MNGAPLRIKPLGRVLRAADADLYADAAEALAAARADASRMVAEAAAGIEAKRARARAEAVAAVESERARLLADAALGASRELAGLRTALADAVADGVARILGARPAAKAAAAAAAHAVESLQDRTGIALRVPPGQADAVRKAVADPAVRVLTDATLGDDECVIETSAGFVRAGIAAQVARLREALRAAGDLA